MDNKEKLGKIVSDAGKIARDLVDTAIQAADCNEDGRFDFADVSAMAGSVGTAVKARAQIMKETSDENVRKRDLRLLRPIFPDSLMDANFFMPKFIRVMDRPKRYAESAVCQGSIGYVSEQKELHIVNIFRDSAEAFGITFYPDGDYEFYYVDPSERDRYIALDEYFSYLKIARVNELQKIAQDLGAKHFKITYKEEQVSFSQRKLEANIKTPVKADVKHNSTETKYSTIEIAAEMDFPGHDPIKPQLKYMQRDPSIQTLIAMRMDESAPLLHQKFMLKMSNSSGLKESDAVKIDAVLKGLRYSGNTTVSSEAKNEARRYFEYDIDF